MKITLTVLLLFLSANIFAQEIQDLSGVLGIDSRIASSAVEKISADDKIQIDMENAKSPLLAAFLSLAIPGAGEFYSESYLKSALFIAIEAAVISTAIIYEGKGDDQTTVFENYANQNWSVLRYANWTIANAGRINSNVDASQYNVIDAANNVNWSELNRLESAIGDYYSHRLAPYADQQYYEMIGKYPQFNPGWVEFGDDPNTPYDYGDPLVEQFHDYSSMRGEANDFYNIASKAVIITVVNHVASALDAAWSASRYNKNLKMNLSLERTNFGYAIEYNPRLNLEYRF